MTISMAVNPLSKWMFHLWRHWEFLIFFLHETGQLMSRTEGKHIQLMPPFDWHNSNYLRGRQYFGITTSERVLQRLHIRVCIGAACGKMSNSIHFVKALIKHFFCCLLVPNCQWWVVFALHVSVSKSNVHEGVSQKNFVKCQLDQLHISYIIKGIHLHTFGI